MNQSRTEAGLTSAIHDRHHPHPARRYGYGGRLSRGAGDSRVYSAHCSPSLGTTFCPNRIKSRVNCLVVAFGTHPIGPDAPGTEDYLSSTPPFDPIDIGVVCLSRCPASRRCPLSFSRHSGVCPPTRWSHGHGAVDAPQHAGATVRRAIRTSALPRAPRRVILMVRPASTHRRGNRRNAKSARKTPTSKTTVPA